jgi:hypothetical protein
VPRALVVLVGTNKGAFFFHSDESRREWSLTGPHLSGWEIYSILGDSRRGDRIFAGTSHAAYGAMIRVSEDFGESWTQLAAGPRYCRESGFRLRRIWQITPGLPAEPDTLYAGVEEAGLFVSRDRGMTWTELEGLTRHPTRPHWSSGGGGLCLHTLLIDPLPLGRMWVAISAVGVFRTDDGGESWKGCNSGLARAWTGEGCSEVGYRVQKMAQHPQDPDTLYLQTHRGVYRSTNGAESWLPIGEGLPSAFGFPICITTTGDLYVVPLESETRCFLDGQPRVYRLRHRTSGWEPMGRGLPVTPHYVGVLRDAMAVDTLEPPGIYFGTTQGDLFYSPDGGEHWHRLPGQFSRILTVKTWVLDA